MTDTCGWQIHVDGRYMYRADRYMWMADTCGQQIHVNGRYMWIGDTCEW
jgi:hypothetical protein